MLQQTTMAPLEREAVAVASRNEPGYRSPARGFRPLAPKIFIIMRSKSIECQLAGKTTRLRIYETATIIRTTPNGCPFAEFRFPQTSSSASHSESTMFWRWWART